MKYFCLKNKQLAFFNRPFIAHSEKEAIAMVRNAILADEESNFAKSIVDAELYFVAEFDTNTAKFKGKPVKVIDVSEIPFPPKAKEAD